MGCERVPMPGGGFAIVCGTRSRRQRCACGKPATLLCDWKVPANRSASSSAAVGQQTRTCDAPICASCSLSPAPDKDLCPAHAAAFRDWNAQRQTNRRTA